MGTTMIALLTQINLRTSIASSLPTTGSLTWLEFTLLSNVCFMLLNLTGHIICFDMDKAGHPRLVAILNKIFFGHAMCIAGIVPIVRIFSVGCADRVHMTYTAAVLGFLILFYLIQLSDYQELLDDTRFLTDIFKKRMREKLQWFGLIRDKPEKNRKEDSSAAKP